MKHKWTHGGGNTYQCSECLTLDEVEAGLLDVIGNAQEMERIVARDDCPGVQSRDASIKTVYTREELTLHDGFVYCCVLCHEVGLERNEISHSSRCVFHVFGVNEVTLRK